VKREILEEIGVEIKDNLRYLHSTSFMTDSGENVVDIVFLCEYESGEAFVKSPDEVEDVMWMSAEEIMNHPKAPIYLKESIKCAESIVRTSIYS